MDSEMIDINTHFITLIGTPLDQSFAARMQNSGFSSAGLNYEYFYTEAGKEHLKEIIDGVRYMPSFIGCAVTKPNKVEVLKYIDELDPLCATIGACNTIIKKGNKLIGYNTDGLGFLRSLKEEVDIVPKGETFFCFGAGGAGRAICSVLAYEGAQCIYITDTIRANAESLVNDINNKFGLVAKIVPSYSYEKALESTVIVNASGMGMGASIGQSPLPEQYISNQFFFDACYNPDKTQFLLNAERKGCQILNGLGMSLFQGAIQIELWTGMKAPLEAMRKELSLILSEQSWSLHHKNSRIFGGEKE